MIDVVSEASEDFLGEIEREKGYTSLPIDHWQTKGSLLRNRRKSSRQFNKEWEESVDWLYCILHVSSVFDQSNNWFLPPMKENEQRSQERFERCHCLWFASTDRRNRGRDGGEQSSASKCQTSLDDRQWPKTCEGKDHDVRKRDFSSSTSSEKRSRSIAFVSCANWSETVRPTSDSKVCRASASLKCPRKIQWGSDSTVHLILLLPCMTVSKTERKFFQWSMLHFLWRVSIVPTFVTRPLIWLSPASLDCRCSFSLLNVDFYRQDGISLFSMPTSFSSLGSQLRNQLIDSLVFFVPEIFQKTITSWKKWTTKTTRLKLYLVWEVKEELL